MATKNTVNTPIFAYDGDSGRIYVWKEKSYVSVTTVLKSLPKEALQAWRERQIINSAIENKLALPEMEDKDITALLSSSSTAHRDTAGNIGSSIHSYIDKMSKGIVSVPPNENIAGYINSFRQFVNDWNPIFHENEATVFSNTWGYAGTMDALVEINGRLHILDFKTGKRVYPEAALQMSAYRHADFIGRRDGTEVSLMATGHGLVLHLQPTGYKVILARTDEPIFETFLSVLDVHNWRSLEYFSMGPELEP